MSREFELNWTLQNLDKPHGHGQFWHSTKDNLISALQIDNQISPNSLFSITNSDWENIHFNEFNSLIARIEETETNQTPPKHVQELLRESDSKLNTVNHWTYFETTKIENWQWKIFEFITDYCSNIDPEILKRYNITDLKKLKVNQAFDLIVDITTALIKYDHVWLEKSRSKHKQLKESWKKYSNDEFKWDWDKKDALTLLKQWLYNKNNENWQWNWVCRNFSCMVKALFESIKANQNKKSELNNVYCTIEDWYVWYNLHENDWWSWYHIWNSFIICKWNSSIITHIDTTWAYRTKNWWKEIDTTKFHMEKTIHDETIKLTKSYNLKPQQIFDILDYYQNIIIRTLKKTAQFDTSDPDFKVWNIRLKYFVERMQELIEKIWNIYWFEIKYTVKELFKLIKDDNE